MPSKPLSPKQKVFMSVLFSATGIAIMLMAVDVIPIDEAGLHAPRWVLGLCGFVFFLAGMMMHLGQASRANHLLAGIMVLAFALIGGWVALFGGGDNFSGGVAFISSDSNISLARIMFGTGSLICFAISCFAFIQFFKTKA